MPRFYFNLCNGPEFTEDGEGGEFPDFAAAHQYAVVSLRDVTAGDLRWATLTRQPSLRLRISSTSSSKLFSLKTSLPFGRIKTLGGVARALRQGDRTNHSSNRAYRNCDRH